CGWLLCAIFLTGTLSVFRDPITRWMEAGPVRTHACAARDLQGDGAALARASAYLQRTAPGAQFWHMELGAAAGEPMLLAWRSAAAGAGRGGQQAVAMDPLSGALQDMPQTRRTEGGRHFMSFHYSLQGGIAGFWVVGWISMCMMVALVSGVVVHKRIFKDFFTFRPGKGQRSWLDAHNATAVLALPFLFMIVYTGLAYFYTSYVPLPLNAAYGWDGGAYGRFQAEAAPAAPGTAGARAPQRRSRTGEAAPVPALGPLLQRAQALTGAPARRILIERPGDTSMTLRVQALAPDTARSGRILNAAGSVTFDAGGAVRELLDPAAEPPASAQRVHELVKALHVASFGGWTLKWLYFLSGLVGTAMVATGTVLFSVKRRHKSALEFGAATPRVYRCIEALNVAAVVGTGVASIAYFYANRLVPADLPGRAGAEIQVFFCVWLASLLHALVRPVARAWVEQLAVGALLCLALPVLNHWTTGQQLWRYAAGGDWERAGVELTAVGLGLLLALCAQRARRSTAQPGTPARARPAPARAVRA
ncbi:MAG TPA: PepSY-associated TM helix domain-containing protein, partial [Pseudorhodoferax sp.]|nr:PepSY-associated TM helix domain-containing protein [Pseudorhodoferax sp.]